MWGMETDWQRLADKVKGEETGSRGMGVILGVILRGSWQPCSSPLAPLLIFNFQNSLAGKLNIQLHKLDPYIFKI